MAFQALAFVLWSIVAIIGAWLLVTGRTLFRLPTWVREGWPLRIFGLIYVVGGSLLAYRALEGSFSLEGVVFSYVVLGLAVWTTWRKWRTTESAGPQL
jgi:hypothetical protein